MENTINQVSEFLKESNAIENVFSDEALADAQKAWDYLKDQPKLTVTVILETHRLLMCNLAPTIAGQYRTVGVRVSSHVAPNPVSVPYKMNEWIDGVNAPVLDIKDKELLCQHWHVLYEDIHPFVDGNGRIGRMFWNWDRLRNGLPIKIVKASERDEYYKLFK